MYCHFLNHKGLKNETMCNSVESCYIRTLTSLMAWGMNVLRSLVVWQQLFLYLLPDGNYNFFLIFF